MSTGIFFWFCFNRRLKNMSWRTKTCVLWGRVFLCFKSTPCTCWHGLTSKRERAGRAGGGGEEEALEEAAASSDERRSLWCLRRWSNRALHTLCSSSILGPAGTLHKHTQKQQHTWPNIRPQLTDTMAPSSGRNESRQACQAVLARIKTKTLGKINFPLTKECFGTWWHNSSSHVYLEIAVCF